MVGVVLLVATLSVLGALVWLRLVPLTFLGPTFIVLAAVIVVALSVRGIALWRFSMSVEESADRVAELRHELEISAMAPTPLDRAREETVKLLADTDLKSSVLLEGARSIREQMFALVGSRLSQSDEDARASARQAWEDAKEVFDDAYGTAADLLRREWEGAEEELRRAEEKADVLLARARPDASTFSARVAEISAHLLDWANSSAESRMADAHQHAEALLDLAEDEAARRLGLVRRPTHAGTTDEAVSERE